MNKLLDRRNIAFSIRSVARLIFTLLSPDTKHLLALPNNFPALQQEVQDKSINIMEISNSEMSPVYRKFCFLTVIKWNNSIYKPQTKQLNSYQLHDVHFVLTRYSQEGMQRVFGTLMIPLVSSKHTKLLYRLFQHAHVRRNPTHQHKLGVFHLATGLTMNNMRSGEFSAICLHQRKLI